MKSGVGEGCPCWGEGGACVVSVAGPCPLQPADYHPCACPRPATQPGIAQRRSVEPCEQAKTQASGWCGRRQGKLAGCGCGSAAGPSPPGGRSLGKKGPGQSYTKGLSPIPALHGREDGIGENPDSQYLRGLVLNPPAGQDP